MMEIIQIAQLCTVVLLACQGTLGPPGHDPAELPLAGVPVHTVEGPSTVSLTAVLVGLPGTEHRVRHHPGQGRVVLGTLGVLPYSGNIEILD